jgi:hypothetical protein
MPFFCQPFKCSSESNLSRYAIHRNHRVVVCAGTQKQKNKVVGDYLLAHGRFQFRSNAIETELISATYGNNLRRNHIFDSCILFFWNFRVS